MKGAEFQSSTLIFCKFYFVYNIGMNFIFVNYIDV